MGTLFVIVFIVALIVYWFLPGFFYVLLWGSLVLSVVLFILGKVDDNKNNEIDEALKTEENSELAELDKKRSDLWYKESRCINDLKQIISVIANWNLKEEIEFLYMGQEGLFNLAKRDLTPELLEQWYNHWTFLSKICDKYKTDPSYCISSANSDVNKYVETMFERHYDDLKTKRDRVSDKYFTKRRESKAEKKDALGTALLGLYPLIFFGVMLFALVVAKIFDFIFH